MDNDCASTFLADDDETLISSNTKTYFSSSDEKSYLMFGCAGESKFRLLNSCTKLQRASDRNGQDPEHTSDVKNNKRRGSVVSSPLKTLNEWNTYNDLQITNPQSSDGSDQGAIEGKFEAD